MSLQLSTALFFVTYHIKTYLDFCSLPKNINRHHRQTVDFEWNDFMIMFTFSGWGGGGGRTKCSLPNFLLEVIRMVVIESPRKRCSRTYNERLNRKYIIVETITYRVA